MDMPTAEESRTFADHTRWLRRRWWVILLVVALGALATTAVTQRQEKVYTSTTSVLVTATGTSTDAQPTNARTTAGLNLDTEAQLVTSLVVADGARQLLKSPAAPEALASRVTVVVPPNTQILNVRFAAPTAAEAQAGSHAFAQAYLDQRAAKVRQDLTAQISSLREQQSTLNKQLQDLAGKVASLPSNSVERQRAESQLGVVSNQLSNLGARISPLVATVVTPGTIISDAKLPSRPSEPNLVLNYGAGLGCALLLGIALALLLERADRRVWRASEVAGRFGLPVLLQLPRREKTASVAPAGSATGRDFSRLRIALAAELAATGHSPEDAHMVVVTAAAPGRGSGFVTANLAAARDRSGLPVLVVCLDPASWALTALGVPPGPGLADVLRGDATVAEASRPAAGLPGVQVMGPGTSTGEPGEELQSELVAELVGHLRQWGGYIVFEAPPAQQSVDGQVLARHADAVLLVVELKRARTPEVEDAVARFEEVRTALLGLVVVPDLGRPSAPRPVERTAEAREAGTPVLDLPAATPAADGLGVGAGTPAADAPGTTSSPVVAGASVGPSGAPDGAASRVSAVAVVPAPPLPVARADRDGGRAEADDRDTASWAAVPPPARGAASVPPVPAVAAPAADPDDTNEMPSVTLQPASRPPAPTSSGARRRPSPGNTAARTNRPSPGAAATNGAAPGGNGAGASSTAANGAGASSTAANGAGSGGTGSSGTGSNGTGSNGTGSNGTGSNGTGPGGSSAGANGGSGGPGDGNPRPPVPAPGRPGAR